MTGSAIYNEFIQVTEGFKMEEEKKPEPVKVQDPELAPIEDPFQRRRKTSIKEQTEIFENVVASIGEGGRAAFQTEEIKLGPEEEEEKEALLNKLFMEEDRVQGGLGFSTILTVVKEIGGFFPIFLILMSVACLMITNFLSDYYHLEWAGIAKDAESFIY